LEFTTKGGADLSQYPAFALAFAKTILESGTSLVFGLVAKPKQLQENYTEFELPDLRSTIMVPDRVMPQTPDSEPISTNWVVGKVDPQPADQCIVTRSNTHHGMNCRATRGGHTTKGMCGFGDPQLESVVMQVIAVM